MIVEAFYGFPISEVVDCIGQNLLLAGRMVSGCIRNLLIIRIISLEKKEVEAQFPEEKIIMQFIKYTIALADILQREKCFMRLQLSKIKETQTKLKNPTFNHMSTQPLVEKYVQITENIAAWEQKFQAHLSNFYSTYKWFNSKVKRTMEANGVSIESLVKETLDQMVTAHTTKKKKKKLAPPKGIPVESDTDFTKLLLYDKTIPSTLESKDIDKMVETYFRPSLKGRYCFDNPKFMEPFDFTSIEK